LNLSALRNHVRSLVAIASTDILSDADLTTFINESYLEIMRDADWPFLRNETTLTLVPGQASYTLPAGVGETAIASVAVLSDDANRRQLRPRSRYSVDDTLGPLINGKPNEYNTWRGNIQFWPTPDMTETVNIRYFSEPSDLVNNTDVPTFDAKFHTIIAYGAAVRVLYREGDDTDRRSFYNAQYRNGLEQMKQDYLSERDRSIFRLGGRRRIWGRRDNYYGV
jgi:hypothetical protein